MTPDFITDAQDYRPLILSLALALALAEFSWRRWGSRRGYDLRSASASLGVMALGIVPKQFGAAITGIILFALARLAPWQLPMDDWRVWVACFAGVEFAYYWFHRGSHMIRWFWANHAVHHSANEFVLPSAYRLGWFGPLMGSWLFFAPLVLVGFPPAMVVGLLGANLLYQYLLHTELVGRLGPLEWVLNTPSHHRAHHSREEDYLDCNFGGVVIVFDHLFGTFRAEPKNRKLEYGLVHRLESNNPLLIGLHELAAMWRDVLAVPGWRQKVTVLLSTPADSQKLAEGFRLQARGDYVGAAYASGHPPQS